MSKVTYLYVKTHNQTGLKYLGITKQDPYKYYGSGRYWKEHLKVHGCDISTNIIGMYERQQTLKEACEFYSKFWNVVESDEWANLKTEEGEGGHFSEQTKENMSNIAKKGYENGRIHPLQGKARSEEWKQNHSKTMKGKVAWNKGKKTGIVPVNKGITMSEEQKKRISETKKQNPHIVSEETRKKLSDAAKRQWQRQHELRGV